MHDFIRGTAIKTPVPLALLAGAGRDGLWLTTAAGRVHEEAGACRMAAVHQQDEARAAREDPLRPERRRHGFLCAHLVCNNIATYPEFGEVGLLFEKCFFFCHNMAGPLRATILRPSSSVWEELEHRRQAKTL